MTKGKHSERDCRLCGGQERYERAVADVEAAKAEYAAAARWGVSVLVAKADSKLQRALAKLEKLSNEVITCEQFLLCTRPATVARPHPILGSVPTCKACNDKIERLSTGGR